MHFLHTTTRVIFDLVLYKYAMLSELTLYYYLMVYLVVIVSF
jgi:hypothetical protein